jgi:hypothetical protein
MLLFPLNVELENKIPCLSYLTYCYKECERPELIYSIAKKSKKYIDNPIEIDPLFLIKIFYKASICLLEQKNYYYSLKYINKCQELINNNKNTISKNTIFMVDEYFNKIEVKILNYILNEKLKFKNLRIDKIFILEKFLLSLTNKKYNYSNDKNNSDVENKYLYALNKIWIKLKFH